MTTETNSPALGALHSEDYSDEPTPEPEHLAAPPLPGPLYGDVAAVLAGGIPDRPRPILLAREDGARLFYAARVNIVFGDPESGKTWLALAAVVTALHDDARCAYVDVDHNGIEAIVRNLLTLGAKPDVLADPERFRYYSPEIGWELLAVTQEVVTWAATVVVYDSAGEVLPLLGKGSNDGDDWTTANRQIFQPPANAGASVIVVDHLAKNNDSRTMGPGGTAAKRRSASGVMVRVSVREQFVPGDGGSAALTVNKDRHGGVRETCHGTGTAGEPFWSLFVLDADGDETLTARLLAPGDRAAGLGVYEVTNDDLAEVDSLSDDDRASVRKVAKAMRWGKDRAGAVLKAWREMQEAA